MVTPYVFYSPPTQVTTLNTKCPRYPIANTSRFGQPPNGPETSSSSPTKPLGGCSRVIKRDVSRVQTKLQTFYVITKASIKHVVISDMQTATAWITIKVDRLLMCYVMQSVSIDHPFNAELFQSLEFLVPTPLSAT